MLRCDLYSSKYDTSIKTITKIEKKVGMEYQKAYKQE